MIEPLRFGWFFVSMLPTWWVVKGHNVMSPKKLQTEPEPFFFSYISDLSLGNSDYVEVFCTNNEWLEISFPKGKSIREHEYDYRLDLRWISTEIWAKNTQNWPKKVPNLGAMVNKECLLLSGAAILLKKNARIQWPHPQILGRPL